MIFCYKCSQMSSSMLFSTSPFKKGTATQSNLMAISLETGLLGGAQIKPTTDQCREFS